MAEEMVRKLDNTFYDGRRITVQKARGAWDPDRQLADARSKKMKPQMLSTGNIISHAGFSKDVHSRLGPIQPDYEDDDIVCLE